MLLLLISSFAWAGTLAVSVRGVPVASIDLTVLGPELGTVEGIDGARLELHTDGEKRLFAVAVPSSTSGRTERFGIAWITGSDGIAYFPHLGLCMQIDDDGVQGVTGTCGVEPLVPAPDEPIRRRHPSR